MMSLQIFYVNQEALLKLDYLTLSQPGEDH